MNYFQVLPWVMTQRHFTNYNIALVNCLVHVLQEGRISKDDQELFVDRIKNNIKQEYRFIEQSLDTLMSLDLKNPIVRNNLLTLAQMLIGHKDAPLDASNLLTGLYYETEILSYPEVFRLCGDASSTITDNKEFMFYIKNKLYVANSWAIRKNCALKDLLKKAN